jgi:WD40 repeat protein
MKIIYLDDDSSKLCDSQTTQGEIISSSFIEKKCFFDLDRPEFAAKTGGRCMKIHPDGLSLAIGDRNGNIRIFDMEIFQQIALIEAHDSEVLSVDYTHSSSMGLFHFFEFIKMF